MRSLRRKQDSQGTNAPEVCYRLLADMSSAYEDRAAPNSNRSVGHWQLRGRIRRSYLRYDSREPEEAYINFMGQCVFLGDRENQCAEEWRSMDTQERFFYSEAGRRAQAKFQRKKREEDERAMAECEALGRNDALCKIEQFLKAKKKIE